MANATSLFALMKLAFNGIENCAGTSNNNDLEKAQRDAVAAAAAFLLAFPPNGGAQKEGEGGESSTSTQSAGQQQPLLAHSPARPISQRGNLWVHLGSFRSEEDMQRVRNKEKVSKRRTEQLKHGVKIRFRCNTWKRTKCNFQMFSFYNAKTEIFDLYESGEHDHSGRRKLEYELYGPIRRRANMVEQGPMPPDASGGNSGSEGSRQQETRLVETPSTSSESTTFSLGDRDKFEKLQEMATKFGLALTLESGNIFSVYHKGQIVLSLVETEETVSVTSKEGEQRWIKADWAQFLWAILGRFAFLTKCLDGD